LRDQPISVHHQTRNEGQQPLGEAEIDEALVRARKAEARAAEKAEIAKGQRLAVITGAVSIVFGVRIVHRSGLFNKFLEFD
jgi:hypothetical protein